VKKENVSDGRRREKKREEERRSKDVAVWCGFLLIKKRVGSFDNRLRTKQLLTVLNVESLW